MKNIDSKRKNKIVGIGLLLFIGMTLTMNAKTIKIMPLGDSITEGNRQIPASPDENLSTYKPSKLPEQADKIAYRGKLWSLLKTEGIDVDFVGSQTGGSNYSDATFDAEHEGYGGKSTKYIKDNIGALLEAAPADIILLHIGTNDPGEHIAIVDSVKNIKATLDTIFTKNPKTKVLLARIIEARVAHKFGDGTWRTKNFNDAVEKMAKAHKHTANIRMVDMESGAGIIYNPCGRLKGHMQPFHSDNNNTYDFHPNVHGYNKMAQKWFTELKKSGWLTATPPPADVTSPVLAEVTVIPNPTKSTKPSYVFSSTEAGKITLEGSCGTATPTTAIAGNNTITFAALAANTYENCTLAVTDAANNASTKLAISAFAVEAPAKNTPPTIKLIGDAKEHHNRGTPYIDKGATATDIEDGPLKVTSYAGIVDINKDGNYTIVYKAIDSGKLVAQITRIVTVSKNKGGLDTDKDGTPDSQDYDDDNDGVLDENDAFPLDPKETTDLDGDGIGDNADTDDDGNGIVDSQEQTWFSYKNNMALVAGSRIEAQGLTVTPNVSADILVLTHDFGREQNAYVASAKTGEVQTGFKVGTIKDSTLKEGTFFKSGTTSVIKMDEGQVLIHTRTRFNKNDTFEIGGK